MSDTLMAYGEAAAQMSRFSTAYPEFRILIINGRIQIWRGSELLGHTGTSALVLTASDWIEAATLMGKSSVGGT